MLQRPRLLLRRHARRRLLVSGDVWLLDSIDDKLDRVT
jgi:hypothetical protein